MFLLSQCPRSAGDIAGICVLHAKMAGHVKHNRLLGKMVVVLPTGCPRSVGLLAVICKMESRSPCYSLGLGLDVVNND